MACIALSPCACARGERIRTQKERRPVKSVAPVDEGVFQEKLPAVYLVCYPISYTISNCNGLQDFIKMSECPTVQVVDCAF